MNKKQQQTLIAIVIGLVVMGYIYFSYLIAPLNKNLKVTREKVEKTQKELNNLKIQSRNLPKIKQELADLQQEVAQLEKLLPTDKELPGLLRSITRVAQNYGVKINNISPQGVLDQPNYSEISYRISAQANYHSLANFLAELARGKRILSFRNINYSAYSESTKGVNLTINCDFILVTYVYKG